MATAYDTANIIIPKSAGYKAGSLYGWNPTANNLVDFAVTRAGATATRVNEAGLIESVAANVPRIDWAEGGSCPSLLVEPERTNSVLQSNQFNTTWVNVGNGVILNNNQSGIYNTTNAWKLIQNTNTGFHYIQQSVNLTGDFVYSIYAKQAGYVGLSVFIPNPTTGATALSTFNLSTGAFTTNNHQAISENVGNGWYRLSFKTKLSGSHTMNAYVNQTTQASETGDGISGIFIQNAQLEAGAYASSYIPTTTTTETRNADVISLSSASALLNDSAGTRYLEATVFDDSASNVIEISDATDPTLNAVLFDINGTAIKGECIAAGVSTSITGVAATEGTYNKLAFGYEVNNFGLHIDGSTSGTDTSGAVPSGLDQIRFTDGTNDFNGRIRVMAEYPYKLDATESNNLTT